MGFDGYLSFGGIEIINAQRTAAYAQNLSPQLPLLLRTADNYDTIRIALQEEAYRSPYLDRAEWVDEPVDTVFPQPRPGDGFYGLYPLSIEGIGDSTMAATVTEGILDGGFVNTERDATRPIRVRGILLGDSVNAVEHGLTWLRNALRSNSCGMHGDMCGYQDLRYFLAKPEVCDPLFQRIQAADTFALGAVDPGTSPLVFTRGVAEQPSSFQWVFNDENLDGVVIRWGSYAFDSPEVLSEHGPLYLRRSNFIANPKFGVNAANWSVTGGTVTRVAESDRTFGRFDQTTPPDLQFNWLPDPSFENGLPASFGWRSSGGLIATLDGTAPESGYVGLIPADDDDIWLEATMLGPFDETEGILSFWTAHDDPVTITVTDTTGTVIHTDSRADLVNAWQRVSFDGIPVRKDYVIRVGTSGDNEFRSDAYLLQAGDTLNTFFDGDTPDGGGVTYEFMGGNASTASRSIDGTFTSFVAQSAFTSAPFGPAVLSFYGRSVTGNPTLLVELVDGTNTVVGSTSITLGNTFTRYALGVPNGRGVRARFTSSAGQFDLTDVMIEAGPTLNDYFDGDSTAPEGYEISWVGATNNSVSRMDLLDSLLGELYEFNVRPYLIVDQGALQNVEIYWGASIEMPMATQLLPYDRTYHRVSCTTGVKKIKEYRFEAGAGIEVDFVFTAATPHAFTTTPEEIFIDLADNAPFDDADWPIPPDTLPPIVDPDLPVLPSPPAPPPIPDIAIDPVTEWIRYYVEIPYYQVSGWAGTVPTVTLLTKTEDVRQVRVRFHPNPYQWDMEAVDPTSFCGEFLLSYLPENSALTVSGVTQQAWAQVAGGPPQPANHLLYGSDGGPMDWPELSCGISYVMTVDIPLTADIDNLNINLEVNLRE